MRKKLLAGILCLVAALSGCGNNAKTIEGEVTMKENGGAAEDTGRADNAGTNSANAAATQENADGAHQGAEPNATEATVSYKGYAFIYNGVVIEMDADAAAIVAQLGEPDSYFEAPSCAFEGIDKIYTYGSFELDTYPTDDKDYVSTVILKDDTITTMEGVGIGSSVTQMEEAYGTEWSDADGMAVYEKDGTKLCFILDGDSIISVEYRSTVIDG